jgi:hypothetical protein
MLKTCFNHLRILAGNLLIFVLVALTVMVWSYAQIAGAGFPNWGFLLLVAVLTWTWNLEKLVSKRSYLLATKGVIW